MPKYFKNQAGITHLMLLVAVVGLVAFLLISNTFDFKNQIFNALFSKPSSQAVSAPITPNPFGKAVELNLDPNQQIESNFEHIKILSSPSLNYPNNFKTIEAWVNFKKIHPGPYVTDILHGSIAAISDFVWDFRVDNNQKLSYVGLINAAGGGISSNYCDIKGKTTIEPNKWYHFAVSKTSNTISLFINGQIDGQGICIEIAPTKQADIGIGGPPYSGWTVPVYMQGYIDEVRISNSARYPNTFVPPLGPFAVDSNTIALWHFDGDVLDVSGNSNNGQIIGSVPFVDSTVPVPTPTPTPVAQLTVSCAPVQNSADPNTIYWGATVNGGITPYQYSWTGTDGLTGSTQTVSKTYTTGGYKTAGVTVEDSGVNPQTKTVNCSEVFINYPYKRVFISSDTTNGNFAGISSGDVVCGYLAQNAKLGGQWMAWLSDSKTAVSSRMSHSQLPYKLLNGKIIANNWTDLTDGTLLAPINIDERGNIVTAGRAVWTNTTPSGGIDSASNNCQNFNSSNASYKSSIGKNDQIKSGWTTGTNQSCDQGGASIYCFEQ